MDVDLSALPPADFTPGSFAQLVGADGALSLLSSLHSTVLPKCEAEEKLHASGLEKPYLTRVFGAVEGSAYSLFALQSRNRITYNLSNKCSLGAVGVWKKDGSNVLCWRCGWLIATCAMRFQSC